MAVTGADLRAARKAAKLTQAHVAAYRGWSVSYLSRIESGQMRVTPAVIAAYRQATGADLTTPPAKFESTQTDIDGLTVDSVRRRNVLGLVAAASVGGAAIEPLAHLLDGLPPPAAPTRVGPTEVAAVVETVDFYTALDLQYGGGLASEIARGSLSWAMKLLHCEMNDDTRDRLHATVAALADRIAWSNYDVGNHQAANKLFVLALNTAAHSTDRDLRAHILLNLSTLTFDNGYGTDAVEVLRLALGDDRVSHVEQANLHAVCARHSGGVGDREAALRHIGMAETALGSTSTAEPAQWAKRVTAEPGHFDSALGLALYATGERDRAIDKFTAALGALGPGRGRTALRCRSRLAVLYMQDGSRDSGETEARQVMTDAEGIRSARVRADLVMLGEAATTYGLPDLARDLDAAVAC